MAKRGREGVLKRQRERARQEKQAVKREKRQARSDDDGSDQSDVDETRLMEEFARLSEDLDNNVITQAQYDDERHRIFVELGIESDD